MSLDNERTKNDCESTLELNSRGLKFRSAVKGAHCIAQNCIREIRNFIENISHLNRLQRVFQTSDINETFNKLTKEFDGYMSNLQLSIAVESRNDLITIKDGVADILFYVYGVSDDQQDFLNGMDQIAGKNKEYQKHQKKNLDPFDFKDLEENEPLLDGSQYRRTNVSPSKRIEKRTSSKDCTEVSFKEFSNNASSQTQIEIR
ncbi:2085_t:CDS:2, partial [Funneliformis mosseae]